MLQKSHTGGGILMTIKIERTEWKDFLNRLTKDRLDWETAIEVLSPENGVQILSEGLPFYGRTLETDNKPTITITTGSSRADHQTHNIDNVLTIAFEEALQGKAATLDIEQIDGTKTLIRFIRPMQVLAQKQPEAMLATGK